METVGKGKFNNVVTILCKLQSHNIFDSLLYFHLFYTVGKATDNPRVNIIPNLELIRETNFNPNLYPVKKLYPLFDVYKQNKGRRQNTPSLISAENLLN